MGFLGSIFTGGGGIGGDTAQDLASSASSGVSTSTGTVYFGSKGISNGVLIAAIAATAAVAVFILRK